MIGDRVRILVVDDDEDVRSGLSKLLESDGFAVEACADGVAGLDAAERERPDLVVTDMSMPRMDGARMMAELHDRDRELPVIIATAFADIESAVEAMRRGAEDYVEKPIDYGLLSASIRRALDRFDGARHLRRPLRKTAAPSLDGLVGTSEPMQNVCRLAAQVAQSDAAVLVTGESGTGKGALARAIHTASSRANAPFVPVHAAALVDTLLESELFGHERGAFSGADKRRAGRFEQAHGGTLFLDEVGEIPSSTQVKLLRVLQEKTFERVGGNEPIHVDIRLVAATSRDLVAEVERGTFREDLYYRMNVIHIEMPPLRIRGDDRMLLAESFLAPFAKRAGKAIRGFTGAARRRILEHTWPGNVRELENGIERAVVLCDGDLVDEAHLALAKAPAIGKRGCQRLADIERQAILTTLEAVDWSTSRAAEILGISVRTIQYRLHEYGVSPKRRSGVPSTPLPSN